MNYRYSSLTKVGLKRTANEDHIGVFKEDDGLLVIVCDGLGGNNAGEVASRLTVDTVYQFFNDSDESDYLQRIKQSIISANLKVMEESSGSLKLNGMATTVEVLFLKGNLAYWGHVGDSRIYYQKNGKLKQLTKDHSLVQKLIDEGLLTSKQAENHPNKNIITRAIGDSDSIDVDLSKIKIEENEDVLFFVCTDGVTTVIKDEELEVMLHTKNLDETGKILSSKIEDRGAPDNYSFVIISKIK